MRSDAKVIFLVSTKPDAQDSLRTCNRDSLGAHAKAAAPSPFTNGGSLTLDLAWDAAEFTYTGSSGSTLLPG